MPVKNRFTQSGRRAAAAVLMCLLYSWMYLPQVQAQNLWSMTSEGGQNGDGTIVHFNPVTHVFTKVHEFGTGDPQHPIGHLTLARNGKLYGVANGLSSFVRLPKDPYIIFAVDLSTNTITKIHALDSPLSGSLVLTDNGKLYGMTTTGGANKCGTIFCLDPSTNGVATVFEFERSMYSDVPTGSLFQASDGKLYGITSNANGVGGTAFSFDPKSDTYVRIHDFIDRPLGNLVMAGNGKLYGRTMEDAANDNWTIFSLDPSSKTFATIHTFTVNHPIGTQPADFLAADNGKIYGLTNNGAANLIGSIFSLDPSTNTLKKIVDFPSVFGWSSAEPVGLLQVRDGKLYGVTYGASSYYSKVFSLDTATHTLTMIGESDQADGRDISGRFTEAGDGKLYGLYLKGGLFNAGTLIRVDPSTRAIEKVHDFGVKPDGSFPTGDLLQASNKKLYGMTFSGGAGNVGTIFCLDPITNDMEKIHDFGLRGDGDNPAGSLVQALNGKLYGMTASGTIFTLDPGTNTFTKIHDLDYFTDGGYPMGSLLQASDGKLYGITYKGGADKSGTIFRIDPVTDRFTKLHDLQYRNGAGAKSLVQGSDSKLYGMTVGGGNEEKGVLFRFDPATATFTKLRDFKSATDGGQPNGSLTVSRNGILYGMTTMGGTYSNGTVFSYDPSSNRFTKHHDFQETDGSSPHGNLMQASNGKLYGMTTLGGAYGVGTLFSLDPISNTVTHIRDLNGVDGRYPMYSSFIEVSTSVSVQPIEDHQLFEAMRIGSYPNPFLNSSTISFLAIDNNTVVVEIFDHAGQRVNRVFDQSVVRGQKYTIEFVNNDYPSGVYYYRITSGTRACTGKMVRI